MVSSVMAQQQIKLFLHAERPGLGEEVAGGRCSEIILRVPQQGDIGNAHQGREADFQRFPRVWRDPPDGQSADRDTECQRRHQTAKTPREEPG